MIRALLSHAWAACEVCDVAVPTVPSVKRKSTAAPITAHHLVNLRIANYTHCHVSLIF